MIIEARAVTKRFGARAAVEDVNLAVPAGTCFGFLGPNGAGKTTLIRLLLALARPTKGEIHVRGLDIRDDPRTALQRVGGIVEEPRFYPHLTGRENLVVFAALLDDAAHARIDPCLERLGMSGRAGETVSKYSLGMRQRLGLARALLTDPELLILDEPTNGLDAAGMVEFRGFVRELVEQEGRTVFISSHLLDEIEKMCDHVAIVNHGAVVLEGAVADLIAMGESGLAIDCDDPERAVSVLASIPGTGEVRREDDGQLFAVGGAEREHAIAVNRALVEAGIGVAALNVRSETLEQRYLEITGGAGEIS